MAGILCAEWKHVHTNDVIAQYRCDQNRVTPSSHQGHREKSLVG